MENSQLSNRELPNTPRVSDKILDYYQKFGQDRDLEKFMRLYSPASSQSTEEDACISAQSCTKNQKISSTKSCEALAMMPPRSLSVCFVANSKSLPNIDIQEHAIVEKNYSRDIIVDINIKADGKKEQSTSVENLKTPKKTFKNTKTQTPESVAKTHRRLEWDSLGDVGYKKSRSTSNISIMERSLLQEFFKEKSDLSEPSTSASNGENPQHVDILKKVKQLKATEVEHSTPPLACSTFVNSTKSGARPKMMSQSTSSTSLNEKFEKYAQTSIIKQPSMRSQEAQCNMSSSYSVIEGTATPSSFEYYSSRSSKSSDVLLSTNTKKQQLKPHEHPFITSITDLLMKRKALGEKNQQKRHQLNNVQNLQTRFQAALDANKENRSHFPADSSTFASFSLSKQAPELDLGIQLICSLIEVKSINGRQKKQLIRNIINRLTRLEAQDKTSNSNTVNSSETTTGSSNNLLYQATYDSVRSESSKHREQNMIQSSDLEISPIKPKQVNTKQKSTTSGTNSSEDFPDKIVAEQPIKNELNSNPQNIPGSRRFQQQDKSSCEHFPLKTNHNALTENGIKVSSAIAKTINKEALSDPIAVEEVADKTTNRKLTPNLLEIECLKTTPEKKISRCTQTSKISCTSTSATATPDLTTQKLKAYSANNELNNSNTDAEQATMREWLNPLTQSEFEYEEKKQREIKKKAAVQQQKLMKKSKHDCGRSQQLNWIESEIKRLECLKHLLVKDSSTTAKSSSSLSSFDHIVHKNPNKDSSQKDKLYDSVYSDKSSVLSESAEQLVQEIEIILEESNENVVNLKDNIKRTKNRKKETQIMYEQQKSSLKKPKTEPKAKLRIINENINVHEEQLLNDRQTKINNNQGEQREKIATPTTDISKESDSLKDLVKQRKKEFMETYKTKKQHHYDALKQQQKGDFNYINLQEKLNEKTAVTTDSEHYSVPCTIPRKYISDDISYYTRHPLPMIPSERKDMDYYDAGKQQRSKPKVKEVISSTSSNNNNYTTTTTSSSMFYMSSCNSAPRSSQNTTSSRISTPRFHDVAPAAAVTGVAVQTSDSIMLSKPIYGPTHSVPSIVPYNNITPRSTACIQVKPKGIAYVIEFDDDKLATSNTTSRTDINSNGLLKESNKKSSHLDQQLTLQQHLEKSKPKFLKHSKERKAILNQLQSMRQERIRQLREIIDNTSINSLEKHLQHLPPPPIQNVRILRTKEMKALTNKRFASLPEVLAKQERETEEKKRRGNRILKDIFNKRLQKRVRSGKLSLNHSKTII